MAQSPDPSAQAAAEPVPVVPSSPVPSAWKAKLARVRKFLAAVVGLISIALTQGLVEGTAAKWCAAILAVATAAGVYIVPNTPSPAPAPKEAPPGA